jgi:hypothetical protein
LIPAVLTFLPPLPLALTCPQASPAFGTHTLLPTQNHVVSRVALSHCGLQRFVTLVSVLISAVVFFCWRQGERKKSILERGTGENIMRTAKKSTNNASSKSMQDNQQPKRYSNNLVILTGNLGADAAFFGANDSAASLRMATNTEFGDKKYVEWHSVVAFRELAKEVVVKCTKGRFIKVYGYLHNSKVVKDDVEQFRTEVIATKVKYLDRK